MDMARLSLKGIHRCPYDGCINNQRNVHASLNMCRIHECHATHSATQHRDFILAPAIEHELHEIKHKSAQILYISLLNSTLIIFKKSSDSSYTYKK